MTNEAFARVKIDRQLESVGWKLEDGQSVNYELPLSDGKFADYVLNDRNGRPLAVLEAKRFSTKPLETAKEQAKKYAELLGVDFIFLANGREVKFWDYKNEAYPHEVKTIFDQENLERRIASRRVRRDIMTVEIDRRIVGGAGRTFQLDAINAVCSGITQGQRKFLLEMATGTGKTRTAAALIKRLFEASHATRVLFLVDRIALGKQTDEEFQDLLRDYSSYVFKQGRFMPEKQVCITTLQSMIDAYHKYSSGYYDLIIVDECHRSIYGKWRVILDHFDGIKVGLTATPCVAQELDHVQNEEEKGLVRDTLRFFELEKPTFRYTMKDAISDGHLVPYHIYKAQTVKTMAEGGFEVKKSEIKWESVAPETKAELETQFAGRETITVDPKALERKFTIPERNRAIVREFRQVMDEGYTGQDGIRRYPGIGKTIVFAVSKRHAATLAKMLDVAFADKKPTPHTRYADFVVSDLRGEGEGNADDIIRKFKREEFPKILVSVNMLDTGFDCPEVLNLVFARFTESSILYQQMRGRGTRQAPHIHKTTFTMFDFVGVTAFHGDEEGYGEGGLVIIQPPRPRPKPRNLLTLDIHDEIDPASRAWLTIDENGNIIRDETQQAHRDELTTRFEAWYIQQENQLEDEEEKRLVRMIGEYLRANAERVQEFSLAHFSAPPFSNEGGRAYALSVFKNQARLEALIAKMNEAVFSTEDAITAPQETNGQHAH